MEETLYCTGCETWKKVLDFSIKKTSKTGRSSKCKKCHNEYVKNVWYPKNSAKQVKASSEWKKRNKVSYLASSLKISKEESAKFIKRGKDKCDVCSSEKQLAFDHCHKTGIARGILCFKCNSTLGILGDNLESVKEKFESFINYLETPITEHPNYLS
ncbi:MAG: endonuclease domain-containing protein [Crocinitomicaceae bacterium]|jgi:hypothetical protein